MYKLRKEFETGKYPPVIKLREKCCTVPLRILLASVSYLCQYKYSFSFQTWNFTFAVLLGCHDCIAAMSGSVAIEWKVTSSSVNPRYRPGQPTYCCLSVHRFVTFRYQQTQLTRVSNTFLVDNWGFQRGSMVLDYVFTVYTPQHGQEHVAPKQ